MIRTFLHLASHTKLLKMSYLIFSALRRPAKSPKLKSCSKIKKGLENCLHGKLVINT